MSERERQFPLMSCSLKRTSGCEACGASTIIAQALVYREDGNWDSLCLDCTDTMLITARAMIELMEPA